jgi:hypothetical protein
MMSSFFSYLTLSLCMLTPVLLLVIVAIAYGLGTGAVRLPGVGRSTQDPDHDWTSAPELVRRMVALVAAALSMVGAGIGLIGYLLPWVQVRGDILGGGLGGSITGIALTWQTMTVGMGFLTGGGEMMRELGTYLAPELLQSLALAGFILILISLFLTAIFLILLLTAIIGTGMVAVPLGLVRYDTKRLTRWLLTSSFVALVMGCGFFGCLQATVGSVQVSGGGSLGLLGELEMELGVTVDQGFWVTMGGLILALIGAISATRLTTTMADWVKKLAALPREEPKTTPPSP